MAKLVEILGRDEKKVKADELNLNVDAAKLKVDGDIIAAKRRINELESAMNNTITVPFNPASYINAKREVAFAKEDLAELEALKTELF